MTEQSAPAAVDAVRAALRAVIDPELGDNIVELGMVGDIEMGPDGAATIELSLTTAACPLRAQIKADIEAAAASVDGITSVAVITNEMGPEAKRYVMDRARLAAQKNGPAIDLPLSTAAIAVSSGKGGVGKSSITVNLAVTLASRGLTVGVLDADIWGFSVPRLLGMSGKLEASNGKIVPHELPVGAGALRVVSMGFLAEEETAVMWRGLILTRAVQQFLQDVAWGDLDYLLIDMPPGTGDIQMGLARMLPRAEVVVVTTPPVAAQKVATRAADMARRGHLRVAGVIENMSWFNCDHGTSYRLFGEGGGERLAKELGVPLLGQLPLDPAVAAGGDLGQPVATGGGELAESFSAIADRVLKAIAPRDLTGCSARMLDALENAVSAATGASAGASVKPVSSGTK